MSETGSYVPLKSSVVEVIATSLCCDGCGIIANNGLKVCRSVAGSAWVGLTVAGGTGFLTLFYCRICAFTEHEAKVLFSEAAKARLLRKIADSAIQRGASCSWTAADRQSVWDDINDICSLVGAEEF